MSMKAEKRVMVRKQDNREHLEFFYTYRPSPQTIDQRLN